MLSSAQFTCLILTPGYRHGNWFHDARTVRALQRRRLVQSVQLTYPGAWFDLTAAGKKAAKTLANLPEATRSLLTT